MRACVPTYPKYPKYPSERRRKQRFHTSPSVRSFPCRSIADGSPMTESTDCVSTRSLGVGFSRPAPPPPTDPGRSTRRTPRGIRSGVVVVRRFLNICARGYLQYEHGGARVPRLILFIHIHIEILAGARASLGGSCRVTLVFVCSWTLPKDIFARERNVIRSRRAIEDARESVA